MSHYYVAGNRVYPVARSCGRLRGNSWLAGGMGQWLGAAKSSGWGSIRWGDRGGGTRATQAEDRKARPFP